MYRVIPILVLGNPRFRLQKRHLFIWWNVDYYWTRAEAERAAVHLESGITRVDAHGWDGYKVRPQP